MKKHAQKLKPLLTPGKRKAVSKGKTITVLMDVAQL